MRLGFSRLALRASCLILAFAGLAAAARPARPGSSESAEADAAIETAERLSVAGDAEGSAAAYREALCLLGRAGAADLRVAACESGIGEDALDRRDVDVAVPSLLRALDLREALGAEAILIAESLTSAGIALTQAGDPDGAERHLRRALPLWEAFAPGGHEAARCLLSLGSAAAIRGDLATGEANFRRALEIEERLDPESAAVASCRNNLGLMAFHRGDLATAEDSLGRALAIKEKLSPGSLSVANTLANLGLVASMRLEHETAEARLRRALEIQRRKAGGSPIVTTTLNNLGIVAWNRAELDEAERLYGEALEISEKRDPGSLDVAWSLSNLAELAWDRGDLGAMELRCRRALEIRNRLAPGSLDVAYTANLAGQLAWARGDFDGAEEHLRTAAGIRSALAPGSVHEAHSARRLGNLLRLSGRTAEASCLFERALDAVDEQNGKLGGADEVRASYRGHQLAIYRDAIDLFVESGEPARAFAVLERSRARQLLSLLAERDLVFGSDLPPELERERILADGEVEETRGALSDPEDSGARERFDEARRRRDSVRRRIRAASPGLAALRDPEPLDLAGARSALDPGTLLLAWSIGDGSRDAGDGAPGSYLFVLGSGPEPLEVHEIAALRPELESKIRRLRALIQRGRPEDAQAIRGLGTSLSTLLLAPAAARIGGADRLLIVPDGPLHLLPFAAIASPLGASFRHLVEDHAVTIESSATVFAELRKLRGREASGRVEVFGDPVYPDSLAAAASPAVRNAAARGLELPPLPATRREAEAIARIRPAATLLHLGTDATEERARALAQDVSIVHFACHGFVDERFPLDSSLALSIPVGARESSADGLLQVWEIFEKLRLRADLVALSACDTALGREAGGEGILGLTRAFQFAGARSVLASLWSVPDESTAELMTRFHEALESGIAKDEALRAAQLALLKGPADSAHPFHWAGFGLYGDWK